MINIGVSHTCVRETTRLTELTVVFLHVGPKVSFFNTVGKCAIPNVLALLASCHMHANLRRENDFMTITGGFFFRSSEPQGSKRKEKKTQTSN